jgi:hypothetical protein
MHSRLKMRKKKSEFQIVAEYYIKLYGKKAAIIYCEGRIDQVDEIIGELENNGSSAFLSDWEDELKDMARYFKKVKALIGGQTEEEFDREEEENEDEDFDDED